MAGRPRLVLQVGPVEVVHEEQPGQVERRPEWDTSSSSRSSSRSSRSRICGDMPSSHLEAHGPAEPAAAQLHLHRLQEVVGLLLAA